MIGPIALGGARFLIFDVYVPPGTIILLDVGPWAGFKTITTAAEEVVRALWDYRLIRHDQRILYIDSEGNRDEILHLDSQFKGIQPGWDEKLLEEYKMGVLEHSDLHRQRGN